MTLVEFAGARLDEDAEQVGPDASRMDDINLKRRIVKEYAEQAALLDTQPYPDQWNVGVVRGLEIAVHHIVAPYHRYPDYQQEWAP